MSNSSEVMNPVMSIDPGGHFGCHLGVLNKPSRRILNLNHQKRREMIVIRHWKI